MEKSRKSTILAVALTFLTVVFLVYYVIAPPSPRKYPDREPVYYWHFWTDKWRLVIESMCDDFNKSQNKYEVIPLSVPGEASKSKFYLSTAGGVTPDVISLTNTDITKCISLKILQPYNNYLSKKEQDYYFKNAYPACQKLASRKDKIYGLATGMDAQCIYYRIDHLKAAGLDPKNFPKTLEGLEEWNKKLTKYNKAGELQRIGFFPRIWVNFVNGFGKGFYDWEKHKLNFTDKNNLRALEYLASNRKKLGFKNIIRFEGGLPNWWSGGVEWSFITGQYSIVTDGQWRVEQLRKYAPNLKYGTIACPPPAKNGNKLYGEAGGHYLAIPNYSKCPKGAAAFAKYWTGFTDPEASAKFETMGGWLPQFPAVVKSKTYQAYIKKNPQFQTFVNMLSSKNFNPAPLVSYQSLIWDEGWRTEESVTRGSLTPKQGFKKFLESINREVKRRKACGYTD